MFSTPVPYITNLKARITDAFATITEVMLENTWRESDYRLDVLHKTQGTHVKVYWCVVKINPVYLNTKMKVVCSFETFVFIYSVDPRRLNLNIHLNNNNNNNNKGKGQNKIPENRISKVHWIGNIVKSTVTVKVVQWWLPFLLPYKLSCAWW